MATSVQVGPAFAPAFLEGQGGLEYDIPQDVAHTIVTRDFVTPVASYAAPTLTDLDPGGIGNPSGGNGFYLITGESAAWTDGTVCKYRRRYANLPTTLRYEWETYQVDYPGFQSATYGDRNPFRLIVPTVVVYQYIWSGPGALNPSGGMNAALAAYLYSGQAGPPYIPAGYLAGLFNPYGLAFLTDSTTPAAYNVTSTSRLTWTMCVESTFHRMYGYYYESITRLAPYY